jgi:hypothetical protein
LAGGGIGAPAAPPPPAGPLPNANALKFFSLCEMGNTEGVLSFLQADAAVDRSGPVHPAALTQARDRSGRTAVLYAARGGSLACIRLLCEHGSDFAAKDRDARSALAYASRRGHVEVAGWLLASGLKAAQCDVHGLTPLHQAVLAKSPAVAELLLSSGADITAKDSNGLTPFKLAKRFLSMESPESRDVLLCLQEHVKGLSPEDRARAGATEARVGGAAPAPAVAVAVVAGAVGGGEEGRLAAAAPCPPPQQQVAAAARPRPRSARAATLMAPAAVATPCQWQRQ